MKLSETADFLYSRPISFSYFSATSPPLPLSLFRNFLCPFFYTFFLREHAIKIYDVVPYDAFNSPYRIESNPRRARMGTFRSPISPVESQSRRRNRRSFFLSSVFLYNHYVLLTSLARTEFPSIIKSISKPGIYLAERRDEILL